MLVMGNIGATKEARMAQSMKDRVVVITGASSGVGRACVSAFAGQGAKLGLLARTEEALDHAVEEARQLGAQAIARPTDVTDADAVEQAAAAIEQQLGPIDVWVNCAMATVFAPVIATTPAEYRRVTDTTYLGYVHGTLSALRRMQPRDRGVIVQVGSALAYRSIPLQSAYCAAKAAIRAFTDSLRSELLHDGSHIKVTMVHLPAVNTPQATRQRNKLPEQAQPVPPMYEPEVIARQIVWAAEHTPRELLVGIPTLKAVWAQKFIPGFLDWYLAKTGWDAQMTGQPNRQQDDMLFHPLPSDPGAHGPYRSQERGADVQMATHGRALRLAAGGLAALALVMAMRR